MDSKLLIKHQELGLVQHLLVGKMKSEEQNLNWYLSKSYFFSSSEISDLDRRDEIRHESLTDCISTIKEFN